MVLNITKNIRKIENDYMQHNIIYSKYSIMFNHMDDCDSFACFYLDIGSGLGSIVFVFTPLGQSTGGFLVWNMSTFVG